MPPKVNKVEADLKKLTKLDGNKICANCPEKMPGYAEMTHCIFICTKCAGVHREYQYKVKGISMSSFTDEDVQQLSRVGNEAHNAVYMARFTPREFQIPNGSDIVKLKDFIRMKYVDRRWYGESTVSTTESNSTTFSNFQPKPTSQASAIAPPAVAKKSASLNSKSAAEIAASMDLLSLSDPITPPKHPADKVFSRSASLALPSQNASQDPFSSQLTATHGQPTATHNFDPFQSDPVANVAESAFDPFGSNGTHPNNSQSSSNGSFDPFGDANAKASGTFQAFGNYNNSSTGYNAFTSPHPNPSNAAFYQGGAVSMQPLPYIKIAPPQPAAPVAVAVPAPAESDSKAIAAAAVTGSAASTQPKNFSAFDDLLEAETAANPFANPSNFGAGNPPNHPNQPQAQAHPNPHHPNPTQLQGHPNHPHPNAPQAHGQYPHQHPQAYGHPPQPYPAQAQPGYGQYPQAYGGYPNPGYGYPPPYPQGPQGAYPPQAPYGYGPPSGMPPDSHGNYPVNPQQPGPYGYGGPQPPPHLAAAPPAAPPAAPAAPDPFEQMSGMAWSALGSKVPSSAPLPPSSSTAASAPSSGVIPRSSVSPVPAPQPQPQPQPAASVNPFDMF
eukprot:gene23623-31989_t